MFACLSKASNLFSFDKMTLKEIMCLHDYKILNKLRLKNYISILRVLSHIGTDLAKKKERFWVIRQKILQVMKLAEYLEITSNEEI